VIVIQGHALMALQIPRTPIPERHQSNLVDQSFGCVARLYWALSLAQNTFHLDRVPILIGTNAVTDTGLRLWQAGRVKTIPNHQADSVTIYVVFGSLDPAIPCGWSGPWQITLLLEPSRAPIIREIEPLDTADLPRQPQKKYPGSSSSPSIAYLLPIDSKSFILQIIIITTHLSCSQHIHPSS